MIRAASLALVAALASCSPAADPEGDGLGTANTAGSEPATSGEATSTPGFEQRLTAIEAAIASWESAPDLAAAHRAAETARNLVVGPDGPYYGDADGDGSISGQSAIGLLPGEDGEPGIAQPPANACIERHVLGGSWADPAGRWATLDQAIQSWSETNNPFPSLPSHPQRIIGWASLTLDSDDLAKAREFAGHARIHSDVSRQALEDCD